ncbi:hypothetical protein Patl1_21717 [Pistacia atlantica]|uniref:Uncharacterized protein n=1 Tax=Pistacia atlantica TaxID=434234 RepID=A0ACC1BJ08_9ROSI|nr:hypothetical protein Patl1_21717 [Pistacia atlantica]
MGNPHVLVIPYPVQSHIIPLMELAQSLAKDGIRITFVNTEYTHKHVTEALVKNEGVGNQVHLVSIQDELESPEDRNQLEKHVESVLWIMPKKVRELMEQIDSSNSDKIACIVADQNFGWAMEIAAEKGLKRAFFCSTAATHLALRFSIKKLIDEGIIENDGTPTKKQMFQLSPTMPAMNTAHFGWACIGNKKVQKLFFENVIRNKRAINLSNWVLCNSTYDLEPAAFNFDPKFIPIGPLLASNRCGISAASFRQEDLTCLKWLDKQQPQSVIYVAFGGTTIFDRTQFQELAMGLELSNRPFLWVVPPDCIDGMSDPFPEGFQDRVATHGYIVSWAPQQKVLAHPSIACFVSHCGWNSTMEGLSNGIPSLCWPMYGDQMHNENYICNVWKVGLGFNREENGIIMREEIKNKVQELLNKDIYKATAWDLKEKMMNNIKEGGASYNNFKHFVEWLKA